MLRTPACLLALLALVPATETQERVPGATWMRYADPVEAGWSREGLAEARRQWEALDSAAWMLVENGVVVVAWGDVERRYRCHSVRKSFMSGLYGVHVEAGTIDREATLADLGIDDEPALTEVEKGARVVDLLKSRSGVFKLAAYEPPQNPKPPRGSYAPGEYWCYNNFDFNTLCTIFEQETGKKVFEEFERCFAGPLGMQDYRVRDGYYHHELDKSIHPAYPFRMSCRDAARYGLLYLYEGAWGDERLLSADWVRESTASYSDTGGPGRGYGYMWWTFDDPVVEGLRGYTALGVGGQAIAVLPDAGLVAVNRTDTYTGRSVSTDAILGLIGTFLAARTGAAAAEPALVPLESAAEPARRLADDALAGWTGEYSLGGERVVLGAEGGALLAHLERGAVFELLPTETEGVFLVEDMEMHVALTPPAEGGRGEAVSEYELLGEFMGLIERKELPAALKLAERALEVFPRSPTAHVMLAQAFSDSGDPELARGLIDAALELDPEHGEALALAASLEQ